MNEAGNPAQHTPAYDSSRSAGAIPDVVLKSASMPVLALNGEGEVEWFSPHAADILRVTKHDELKHFNFFKTMRHRDRSVLATHLDQVIREHRPARCELEVVLPDAGRQWVRLISHPGRGSGDAMLCWAVIENLTQIRRMEKNEAFYQRAAEIAGKAESLRDFSSRIFDLLRILFGIENGCVAIKNHHTGMIDFPFSVDVKNPLPVSRPQENGIADYVMTMGRMVWLNDARSGDKIDRLDFDITGAMPSDWIGVPLMYKQQVLGMVAIFTYEDGVIFNTKDIGLMLGIGNLFEVYLERMELQEAHARLSAAIEQADETILITDAHGIILYANPALEKITGYKISEVLGKTPAIFQSGKHSAEFYQEIWTVLGTGHTWRGTFINRRKDGTLYEEQASISPVRNHEGKAVNYVAVKRDISRERTLERQYLQVQKMEAINQLMSGISRDFRNLFMVVRQNAEYLSKNVNHSDKKTEVEEILHASSSGELLLRQLDYIAGDKDEQPVQIDINGFIQEFEPMANRLTGATVRLELNLHPRPVMTSARSGRLAHMLSNLLMQSIKRSPSGGLITIKTHPGSIYSGQHISFIDQPPDADTSFAKIEISDEGAHHDLARLADIFTFGVNLDAEIPGENVGLATSFEIIRQHRGYLAVENHASGGAAYVVYLPLSNGSETTKRPPLQVATTEQQEFKPGNETILLAEDEEGARRVISRMLQDQGYTVIEAENGAMAIKSMLFYQGEINLLLTDLIMPDFDGRTLADQIRGLKPEIKVLFTSGYQQDELEESGISLPPGSLLKKPFRREELIALVQKALGTT
ncbi:MAG TPA: PAS domain S-box protein [Kiritimatiellia bacterium]|nr:PAS domain S-box protein [Kiritimatiellia bacterium]